MGKHISRLCIEGVSTEAFDASNWMSAGRTNYTDDPFGRSTTFQIASSERPIMRRVLIDNYTTTALGDGLGSGAKIMKEIEAPQCSSQQLMKLQNQQNHLGARLWTKRWLYGNSINKESLFASVQV